MSKLREDLALAAYAVSVGFKLRDAECDDGIAFVNGIPNHTLGFRLDDVHVWKNARRWLVAKIDPTGRQLTRMKNVGMHEKLLDALLAARSLAQVGALEPKPVSGRHACGLERTFCETCQKELEVGRVGGCSECEASV